MLSENKRVGASTSYTLAGLFSLSLRLIVGWTYFSAFWRRLILENKLDPDAAGYIGEKFNHFLPHALGIKPIIEHLVSNPEMLWWAMLFFTITEGIVGLAFMLGFFTRLMSIGVLGLAMGVLLGSGWIGTTCLDEWQIGILGITAAFTVFLSGGGRYSLDALFAHKYPQKKWVPFLTSGNLPLSEAKLHKLVLPLSLCFLFIALFTNQYFHNGVWGKLHNKSVAPLIEISDAHVSNDALTFTVFRVEGVDVYGSFLIGLTLKDEQGGILIDMDGEALAKLSPTNISNAYVAKVKPGKHSLVIPLGAKATIRLPEPFATLPAGKYHLMLTDISGLSWQATIEK